MVRNVGLTRFWLVIPYASGMKCDLSLGSGLNEYFNRE